MATTYPNRYKGTCVTCGHEVAEGQGFIQRNASHKWEVSHNDGQHPAGLVPVPAPKPAPVPVPLGVHKLGEDYFKVQESRGKRQYARRLVIRNDGTGKFVYAPGVVRDLSDATLLSYDEAKEFGLKHSFCVKCGIPLTDALSVIRGIGPVCERQGQWAAVAPKRTAQAGRDAVAFLRNAGTHDEVEDEPATETQPAKTRWVLRKKVT